MTDDIFFASVTDLSRRLRAKEFSAVELARAFSDRLEKLGRTYNATALLLREQAIDKAREVDGDLKRERFRGTLQGIPFAVKDLLSVAGHPTTWGALPFAGQVFDYDATVVKKLAKVGAVLTGKLAMVELAGGGGYRFPSASLFGSGLNPWDRSRWSGGSSSGSGAAVAAGIVPFALGSETSGSIITPCAYCGITGLRPTYGLVSRHGAMALSWTLDKIGPMCRTAEDCGFVLQAIAGKDEEDPGSAGKSFYFTPQFARDMKMIRIGYSPVDFEEWAEPGARPAFQAALEVFKGMGVTLIETSLPDFPYGALTNTVIGAEGASVFEDLIESGGINKLADKKQIAGLRSALDIPARDYLKSMRVRRLIQNEFRKLMTTVDVLMAPARYRVASRITAALDAPGPNEDKKPSKPGFSNLIPATNLTGMPALCFPCGFSDGMPLGLQLVGPAFTENRILALGMEYQKRTAWHKERPRTATTAS